jgi:hypothetical protein
MIIVYSENYLKPANIFIGQNSEFLDAKADGSRLGSSYSYHCAFKGYVFIIQLFREIIVTVLLNA